MDRKREDRGNEVENLIETYYAVILYQLTLLSTSETNFQVVAQWMCTVYSVVNCRYCTCLSANANFLISDSSEIKFTDEFF